MVSEEPQLERIRLLGRGATGRVELGRLRAPFGDLAAGSEVAIKSLERERAADERALAAFAAEAEAGRLVRDPSLVRVLHFGQDAEGRPYLLLTYVPGRSLREILADDGPLPEPLLRSVGQQLAGALAALHARGMVHGDIKPENVRLDDEGRAVLLDLGFAFRLAAENANERFAGSLAYISPERARGGAPSLPADVFALGVVLYELATGFHPFGYSPDPERARRSLALVGLGSSSGELLRRSIEVPGADELLATISEARAKPASHIAPQLSPFLDCVLQGVLERLPERRPRAQELAERLRKGEAGSWWRDWIAPRPDRARGPDARAGIHLTPLVGRDLELGELAASLDAVRERERSGVVWLSGPEGSGKWRLVSEFAERSRRSADPPLYLYARCTQGEEARPAGSLFALLRRFLQLAPDARPAEREEEILRGLVVPRAARTLLAALDPELPGAFEESVAAALTEWLVALGRRGALLVFLDDLQRAGPETLGALGVLMDSLAETRMLLVLGARDDRDAVRPAAFQRLRDQVERLPETTQLDATHIALGPLSEAAVATLVNELFDHTVPRLRLAHTLWLRSRGNPGLIAEILRDLVARGNAVPRDDGDPILHLTIAPDELPLPSSLGRIISERIAALAPEDKLWLERLSVVGGRIAADFLVQAFPPTKRTEIDIVLARLVRKGWLVPVADRYRFARPALREAVYLALPKGRRERLHRLAARGLAGLDSSEDSYQRAFHLRAAEEHEFLLRELVPLIARVRRRTSAQRMLTLARWGIEALQRLPATPERNRDRLSLLEVAADAADRLGQREEQREFLDHLADLDLDHTEHGAEGARVYILHGRYAASTGQFGLARGMLRNALQLAEDAASPRLESEASRRLALVQAQIGEIPEARELARRARDQAQDEHQLALAHLALAMTDVLEDRVERALDELDQAISILRGADQVRLGVVAHAQMLRGRIWRSAGWPRRALGAAGRAVRLAQRAGERRLEAEARARYGGLLLDVDRADEAEAQLRDALLVAGKIEDRRGAILAGLGLGILLWEEDDLQAVDSIARATELAHDIGFYRAEALGLALMSRVHMVRNDHVRADETSALGIELVERHGAELADRVTITGTRALVLRTSRRAREARAMIRRLEDRIQRRNLRIEDPRLRARQLAYATRLLEAVLSPDGPVYPRTPTPAEPGR